MYIKLADHLEDHRHISWRLRSTKNNEIQLLLLPARLFPYQDDIYKHIALCNNIWHAQRVNILLQ